MDTISLAGSTSVVVDFFEYCVNSILFQREVYPKEDFRVTKKYGLSLLVTTNDELKAYIDQVVDQVRIWLNTSKISKLILVIKSRETGDVLERWQFDIEIERQQEQPSPIVDSASLQQDSYELDEKTKTQIRAIMRQIAASVTFLPELDPDDCTINILVHTDQDVNVPTTWGDSDPKLIKGGGEHVRLKSFSTSVHKVSALVAYRMENGE
ncbi:HORMA domain-containing protein [Dichotomocladium elegans]|nr:HORMA domain-containing protein [Dichotomocladium elegans]